MNSAIAEVCENGQNSRMNYGGGGNLIKRSLPFNNVYLCCEN